MYDTGTNIVDNESMLDISSLKKSIVSCHSIYKGDQQQDVHEILNIILHHVHTGNSKGINYNVNNNEKTIIGYPVRKIIIYAAKKWYEDLNQRRRIDNNKIFTRTNQIKINLSNMLERKE